MPAFDPSGQISIDARIAIRNQAWKFPCVAATTGDITIATGLNAGDTIDGVTLAAGDHVLVWQNSPGSENGIWIVGATPVRSWDMDQDATTDVPGLESRGAFVYIIGGSTHGGKLFKCSNTTEPTIGTDTLTFVEFEAGGSGLDIGIALFLDHGNAGATETIDQSAAMAHAITLDANCTLTFSGAVATVDGDPVECSFRLYVETPGAFTITWPGSVIWPNGNDPDIVAAGTYVMDFTTPDGGTNWYGFAGQGSGNPADDVFVWMPLTTVDGGEPVLVWDGDDSLIPTLVPV